MSGDGVFYKCLACSTPEQYKDGLCKDCWKQYETDCRRNEEIMANAETTIKNYVNNAFKQLGVGIIRPGQQLEYQFTGDIDVRVELVGETSMQQPKAIVHHSELGQYLVFLNGTAQKPGKPQLRF